MEVVLTNRYRKMQEFLKRMETAEEVQEKGKMEERQTLIRLFWGVVILGILMTVLL
jgi:hypothetical protein